MKSHSTEFTARELAGILGAPLLAAMAIAAALHATAAAGLLPGPRPTLDTDRTILIHQADAARNAPPAEIVLVGDSSCLMDVSARQLAAELGQSVLNLGTLSYLDLDAYGRLLRESTRRHAPKAVVVLMHPEALRRMESETYTLSILTNYLAGRDQSGTSRLIDAFHYYAGVDIASGRLLARLLPTPLRGAYGARYGFSRNLETFMAENLGSAVDPGFEKFSGNAEYRLAATLEKASRSFRGAIPPGTKLLVGITPVPAGFARGKFAGQRDEMLQQWARWLSADGVLTDLPSTLPDEAFARVAHLKPVAIEGYTRRLAAAIALAAREKETP